MITLAERLMVADAGGDWGFESPLGFSVCPRGLMDKAPPSYANLFVDLLYEKINKISASNSLS